MSRHARVEELSDSDPDEMDISHFDPTHPDHGAAAASSSSSSAQHILSPQNAPQPSASAIAQNNAQREKIKNWQCLYPVYFDANRSRDEGRRVGKAQAVANPLARDICDAVQALGLELAFEPEKTHPKDWANPGRVRVALKEGRKARVPVNNKHHLYLRVAEYLQAHPTTKESPLRLRIQGLKQDKPPEPPAVPRGWKMGTVLPFHSAAVSGGGVSENLFKDMMREMGGAGGLGGLGGMANALGGAAGPAPPQLDDGSSSNSSKKKKGKK